MGGASGASGVSGARFSISIHSKKWQGIACWLRYARVLAKAQSTFARWGTGAVNAADPEMVAADWEAPGLAQNNKKVFGRWGHWV